MPKPWSFEDGPEVSERILREYARWRLGTLPVLPNVPPRSDPLVEAYRRLDVARAQSADTFYRVSSNTRMLTTALVARNEARIAGAVWEVVHRHLVAAELARLKSTAAKPNDVMLVLRAERAVESFAACNSEGEVKP